MNKKYLEFGLLAVGLIALLWYLLKHSKASGATTAAASGTVPAAQNPGAVPSYPAPPAAIQPGNIVINEPGTVPYLNYNRGLDPASYGSAELTDGANSACGCDKQAGQPVNFPTVDAGVFQSAVDSFQSFLAKQGGASSNGSAAPAPVVAPKPVPKRPAPVQHLGVA